MMKYWTAYLPSFSRAIVYMLQNTEYRTVPYLHWLSRVIDFRKVMYRRSLDRTKKATLLLYSIQLFQLAAAITIGLIIYYGYTLDLPWLYSLAATIFIALPLLIGYGILLPLWIGWLFIQKPRELMITRKARSILSHHLARKIAVVGSYGKTTAKEMLTTVLSEKFRVASTPGNMNTAIGISRFASKLDGDEDILVIELGEEKPGDIRKLARLSRPTDAIITGISEAHLSSFKTIDRTIATIFEIADFVDDDRLFKNHENQLIASHKSAGIAFDQKGVDGWKITHAQTAIDGTSFTMTKKSESIDIFIPLIGLHIIPVAAAVAAMATRFGLSGDQIKEGFRNVQPYEHRMQPRPSHGAWIIDDTYNGNSEGVKAGLAFLKSSGAKRRIYVTPGLVEAGDQTEAVHIEIGKLIAASADRVYLMKNSVTDYIVSGLKSEKFKGELLIIDEPLEFYQNMDQFVAAGDVVLMQNDWTDNYS
jgi:UDP-N-acetylmuramoyl-tripeptide--D-alanyl-D-alanine ligase